MKKLLAIVLAVTLNSTLLSARIVEQVERYTSSDTIDVFIPQGTYMCGGNISYSEYDGSNLNIAVLKNLGGLGYSFSVTPFAGYFVADNIAVGGRLSYSRSKIDLKNLDLSLGEDFNISLSDIYNLQHTYSVAAFGRHYMPIAHSRIFAMINELRLSYSHGQGKNSTGSGVDYDGAYQRTNALDFGLVSGLTAFVTNNVAVEASVGVLGMKFRWGDQVKNQIENANYKTCSASFKVDLLSVNLGMVVYL